MSASHCKHLIFNLFLFFDPVNFGFLLINPFVIARADRVCTFFEWHQSYADRLTAVGVAVLPAPPIPVVQHIVVDVQRAPNLLAAANDKGNTRRLLQSSIHQRPLPASVLPAQFPVVNLLLLSST